MICYHFSFFPSPSPFSLLFLKIEFSLGEWRSGGVRGSLSGPQAHYLGQEESLCTDIHNSDAEVLCSITIPQWECCTEHGLTPGMPYRLQGQGQSSYEGGRAQSMAKSNRTDTKHQKGLGARNGVTGNLTARTSCGWASEILTHSPDFLQLK